MRQVAEEEFTEYVMGRLPALRRLAYSLSGDRDQVDDLVQETATKLFLNWSKVPGVQNLDAYVRSILVRVFLDSQRKGWWRIRLTGTPLDIPQQQDRGAEDRAVLRAALSQVPARQRAVLVLRFLHDLPVNEVAQALGCSPGTVKSQTVHGLAALRRLLGDREFAPARSER